ncbi:MAG: polysaccharide biosynthesis C-terminal domain-containing protein [Bacteroidota bacterium]
MNSLKKLAGQTVVYGLSTILGRLLNYLLVPLYTSVFIAGEYGIVTDLYAYVAFFNVLYLFGLETTYFRLAGKESLQQQAAFNQVQTLVIINALAITTLLVVFAGQICDVLGYPGQERYIYWLAAVMMIDAVVAIPFARLRLDGHSKRFALTKLLNIVVVISLNLIFILWLPSYCKNGCNAWLSIIYFPDLGVGHVFLANLIANALYLVLLSDALLRFRPSISSERLKFIISYALPIMFLGLAGVTNEMLSRAILKYRLPEGFYEGLTSLGALGVFGACYKLSVFMVLAIQAFKYAAEPFFFINASDKKAPALYAKVMHGFIIFAALLMMAVIVNLDWISNIFLRSEIYQSGLEVVPWLLLAGLFLGIYYNLSVWFKLTDRTRFGAYISGIGALFTIVLNWFFIPIYGYMASALIAALVYLLMCMLSYAIGQRYYPIPYRLLAGLTYIVVIFSLALALHQQPWITNIWWKFAANNLLLLACIVIILRLEKVQLTSLLRRR